MNTITHALLPVIATRLLAASKHGLRRWEWIAIATAGALPDLLHPHLSLDARMSSWSHGLPCWLGFTIALLGFACLNQGKIRMGTACLMSLAYLLHLFCDAISGGINWSYPFASRIWGDYWVDPIFWIPLDIGCLLACYFLFRLLPLWRKKKPNTAD